MSKAGGPARDYEAGTGENEEQGPLMYQRAISTSKLSMLASTGDGRILPSVTNGLLRENQPLYACFQATSGVQLPSLGRCSLRELRQLITRQADTTQTRAARAFASEARCCALFALMVQIQANMREKRKFRALCRAAMSSRCSSSSLFSMPS